MTIKLIMPMAGSGERFKNYSTLPKPLIQVDGMPMFNLLRRTLVLNLMKESSL